MVRELGIEAFVAARVEGALVLDVHEGFEFAAGHVPGARWIPLGMLVGSLVSLAPRPRGHGDLCIREPEPGRR